MAEMSHAPPPSTEAVINSIPRGVVTSLFPSDRLYSLVTKIDPK